MTKALWQLLLEESSKLTCDECFAVMEYYADLLAQSGEALLPFVQQRLKDCPSCQIEHRRAPRRLALEAAQSRTERDRAASEREKT
jgi:hypothetical protein